MINLTGIKKSILTVRTGKQEKIIDEEKVIRDTAQLRADADDGAGAEPGGLCGG